MTPALCVYLGGVVALLVDALYVDDSKCTPIELLARFLWPCVVFGMARAVFSKLRFSKDTTNG